MPVSLLHEGCQSYVIIVSVVLSMSRITHKHVDRGCQSYVIIVSVVLSVSRITHEHVDRCQPNTVGMGKR